MIKSTFAAIISIAWLFIGYFTLPLVIRGSLGFLGTIAGAVNDRSRGGFDRLKNFRKEQPGKRLHAFKSGELYNESRRGPTGALARRTNALGRRAGLGVKGNFGYGAKGQQAAALTESAQIAQTLKDNPRLAELANNDAANAVVGLSGGTKAGARAAARQLFDYNTAEGRQEAADAIAAADFFLGADGRKNAAAALQTMAQNKSRAVGAGRVDIVSDGIDRLAGGNEAQKQALAYGYQYNSRSSGRADLGGNFMSPSVIAAGNQAAAASAARGDSPDQQQHFRRQAISDRTMMDGVERTEVSNLVRGHTNQVKQMVGDANNQGTLERMIHSDNHADRAEAAVRILELQKALPYANGGTQAAINDFMARNSNVINQTDIERSLVTHVNSAPNNPTSSSLNTAQLSAQARVYDQSPSRDNAPGGPGPNNPTP